MKLFDPSKRINIHAIGTERAQAKQLHPPKKKNKRKTNKKTNPSTSVLRIRVITWFMDWPHLEHPSILTTSKFEFFECIL